MKTIKHSGYAFEKLLRRNIRYLFLLVIPVIVLLSIVCIRLLEKLETETVAKGAALAVQSASHVDSILQEVITSSDRVAHDIKTQRLLSQTSVDLTKDYISILKDVQQLIGQEQAYNTSINGIVVCPYPDLYFINESSAWHYRYQLRNTNVENRMLATVLEQHNTQAWQMDENNLYYISNLYYDRNPCGVILTYTDFNKLAAVMTASLPYSNARLMMVDEGGMVVADSGKVGRGRSVHTVYPSVSFQDCLFTDNNNTYSVNWVSSRFNGWQFVLVLPQNEYNVSLNTNLLFFAGISCIVLLMFFVLAYRIARATCRPYEEILSLLSNPSPISEEEYARHFRPHDDLGMIATLIYKTRYQNLALHTELTEQQTMLRRSQQAALQAQMSPHFLYNTLESINWMAIHDLGDGNRISEMITRLARFTRVVTRNDEPLVSIRKEIEHATLYLDIQKLRFGDQFTVHWAVDPQLLDYKTIRVSLQPLLENCLKYGVRDVPDGQIDVSVQRDQDHIVVFVQDNGPGIDPKTMASLRSALEDTTPRDTGIGLINLHTRIRLLFGQNYGLEIESADRITKILFRIPLISAGIERT